jgi:PAS domain S-box-containing protein
MRMKAVRPGRYQHGFAVWVIGAAALAGTTWLCHRLSWNAATTACAYLVIIVLLSLADSLLIAVLFSLLAVACLDFFFTEPLFLFAVAKVEDLAALTAFLITSIVITGLVRRLRLLAHQHRAQAQLLDLTRDAVFVRDPDDVITYWNRGGEELYGWKREEAIGQRSHDLLKTVFPAPHDTVAAEFQRKGYWEGELLHTRRDGTQIVAASRWSVQRDETGTVVATLETNNDITERRRTEEALRRTQETYLAEAQTLSRTGSFGWKLESGAIYWSEEGYRIFGFDSNSDPSMTLMLSRVHPQDLDRVQRVIRHAEDSKQGFDLEYRIQLPDERIKFLRLVAKPMQIAAGSIDFVGAVMDITAIRIAQDELNTTRSELAHVMRVTSLGELTASIAHEINQSLGAVVANAEASLSWLDRERPDLEEARAAVGRIVRDGHRAGEVIRRVRALAKKADVQMAEVSVSEIIDDAVSLLQHEAMRYRVMLRALRAENLPALRGDRIQLQQVLINLMLNGMEAMQAIEDRARELLIVSELKDPDHVRVSVADSGVGLSSEGSERMFNAFYTTKPSGMGMGLSICRSIIQAHGGTILAVPNEPFGTIVRFTLPVSQPEVA